MQPPDVEAAVSVHLQAFQNFFLSFLGPRFLRELYASILSDPSGFAFVAGRGTELLGFVAGTDQPSGFYRRLLQQRWWRFGLAAIRPAITHPAIIPRLLRAFQKPEDAVSPEGCGTLMSIAVLPGQQSRGAGQALVEAFLNEAAVRNLTRVDLTTDRDNNEKVNRFYQRLGFVCTRTFITPEGRWMNEYEITIKRGR